MSRYRDASGLQKTKAFSHVPEVLDDEWIMRGTISFPFFNYPKNLEIDQNSWLCLSLLCKSISSKGLPNSYSAGVLFFREKINGSPKGNAL